MTFIGKCIVFLMYLAGTAFFFTFFVSQLLSSVEGAKKEGKFFTFECGIWTWFVFAGTLVLATIFADKGLANEIACGIGLTAGIVIGARFYDLL